MTAASFLLALIAFGHLLQMSPDESKLLSFNYFRWIQSDSFVANFGFMFDQLTGIMILVVTGIGFLIHIYSTGYMAHEGGYYRFFAYLNLFMFSMLTLVLANNFVLMFVGWEGVGLCSYLLIGFYFQKKSAGRCWEESLHCEPSGRLRIHVGDIFDFHDVWIGGFLTGV